MTLSKNDIRAAVFDLDGTLLDTLVDIGETFNRVLEKQGLPPHSIEKYRYLVGDGAPMLVRRALPEHLRTPEMIEHCLAEYLSGYLAMDMPRAKPYDGIPELLDGLTQRGVKLAVLSNKSHPAAIRSVGELLGDWTFDAVFGLRENVPRKPDPAGALEIAGILDVPVDRCVFIGDTATDMQTALAAGMVPVGVLWGFRSREELRQAGARYLIERPAELLGHIESGGH